MPATLQASSFSFFSSEAWQSRIFSPESLITFVSAYMYIRIWEECCHFREDFIKKFIHFFVRGIQCIVDTHFECTIVEPSENEEPGLTFVSESFVQLSSGYAAISCHAMSRYINFGYDSNITIAGIIDYLFNICLCIKPPTVAFSPCFGSARFAELAITGDSPCTNFG